MPGQQSGHADVFNEVVPMQAGTAAADLIVFGLFRRGVEQRGNQARGMPRVRPSLRSTHMVLALRLSAFAKVFTPCPLDEITVFFHYASQFVQSGASRP